MQIGYPTDARLLERTAPEAALWSLVTTAAHGDGAVAVVIGEPGIGKTSVLGELIDRASAAGIWTGRACAGELEGDVPFGVVRDLFSPLVQAAERDRLWRGAAELAEPVFAPATSARTQRPPGEVLHGLYWLTVNACETRPRLLVVDDLQWADDASVRFLNYLARRVEGLACLLVLGLRAGVESQSRPDVLALTGGPATARLELSPLGIEATHRLISRQLGTSVDEEFAAACHTATGGNPLLSESLAAELIHHSIRGERADIDVVGSLGGEGLASWLRRRLQRCGPAAATLAQAVAILGPSATYRRIRELADVGDAEADRTVRELIADRVLLDGQPIAFAHPIFRAAVITDLGAGASARQQARAASLLAADGDDADAAHHFCLAEPLANPVAVTVLTRAADRALARGAPEAAAAYLKRALAEPPEASDRAELRYRLAAAELHAGWPAVAAEDLAQAYAEAHDVALRARIALLLARCQVWAAQSRAAVETKERALAEGGDPETLAALELDLLEDATAGPQARALLADRLAALRRRRRFDVSERRLMAILALELALTDGPARRAADLARRALADGELIAEGENAVSQSSMALLALTVTDQRASALAGFEHLLARVSSTGSLWAYGVVLAFRGWARTQFGELREAQADLLIALDPRHGAATAVTGPLAVGALIETTLERAGTDAALVTMDQFAEVQVNAAAATSDPLVRARARVMLARGMPEQALEALRPSQELEQAFGGRCAAWTPWRLIAARAHLALGDDTQARSHAREQHQLAAAFGSASAVGGALHCRGVVEHSVPMLRDAVRTLARSPARRHHAHALVDLGAMLRSRRANLEAREPLRAGLDVALACGAQPLAERAREELLIAGGRPRRLRSSGADALTPSELRTARLAASGLTNRGIAQAGFVSPRTVEMHLSNAYSKLGITRRDQLSAVLPPLAD